MLALAVQLGDATIDDVISNMVHVNRQYLDHGSAELVKTGLWEEFGDVQLPPDSHRYMPVMFYAIPHKDPPGLVMHGALMHLDGTPYEDMPNMRRELGMSVEQMAVQLIAIYGSANVDYLVRAFQPEFELFLDEDYGHHEMGMLEFFMRNLPWLQNPED